METEPDSSEEVRFLALQRVLCTLIKYFGGSDSKNDNQRKEMR